VRTLRYEIPALCEKRVPRSHRRPFIITLRKRVKRALHASSHPWKITLKRNGIPRCCSSWWCTPCPILLCALLYLQLVCAHTLICLLIGFRWNLITAATNFLWPDSRPDVKNVLRYNIRNYFGCTTGVRRVRCDGRGRGRYVPTQPLNEKN
jgi:hypothetical protein